MSFKGLEHYLEKNVYQKAKGEMRLSLLWHDLLLTLPFLEKRNLRILDIGGGAGHLARKLARLGHEVTICDVSQEMLDIAGKQNREKGLEKNIQLINCGIDEIEPRVKGTFDLVLIHVVLGWLDEPEASFKNTMKLIKEGGCLSLLYYNIDRLILKNGIHGHFKRIKTGTYIQTGQKKKLTPTNPLKHNEVMKWIESTKMEILSRAGIRIFLDMTGNEDSFMDRLKELEETEKTYSRIEPYTSIAQHIHLVCRKS